MAKNVYNIPYSLDSSYLDMEITVQNDEGIGIRPFPIKNILLVLLAIISCFVLVTKTFINRGNIVQKIIFVLLWGILCYLLLIADKTKEMGITRIFSFFSYMNGKNRYVNTRRQSSATDFMSVCGMESISKDGLIHYVDGSVGLLFDIVGNGSILLFESHKQAIIDRVDTYWRKVRSECTHQFVTIKEPQNVASQIEAIDHKKKRLSTNDPDLVAMVRTNRWVLTDIIGSSFKSIHQYMILQASDEENLNLALNVLVSEVENSGLMFKHVTQLEQKETENFFRYIYGSKKEYK